MTQEVIITVGLPASGKTTWTNEHIKTHPEYVNINRDDIRLMLQGRGRYNKFSKWRENLVTDAMLETARSAIKNGKSIIISDTNLNPDRNKLWKQFAKDRNVNYREQLFTDIHVGICVERDMKREFPVGSKVIMGMFERGRGIWFPTKPAYDPALPDVYLVDIDGTLAEMHGRGPFDWDKVDTDLPKTDVIEVVKSLHINTDVVILSGRDGVCKGLSEKWLDAQGVTRNAFYIRPEGDCRKDTLIKEEIYNNHIKGKYNVLGVFDDRDQVVHMWRHLGLTVFQVNYGAF